MSTAGNKAYMGNTLADSVVRRLADTLPRGWRVTTRLPSARSRSGDVMLRVSGPGTAAASILVEARQRVEPRDVDHLATDLAPGSDRPIMVVAPFLSARTRERLTARGFGYADLTGNARLSLRSPALFVETRGEDENPTPALRDRRSLKGAKAGRLVRALCDWRPPFGLRELAARAGVDAGYASRIIAYLEREALVTRGRRGPITNTDWPGLLRRWSQEYSPFQPKRVSWYLSPRGLASFIDVLRARASRYAVSGSWAAAQFAPVAPPRIVLCYDDDIRGLVEAAALQPVDAGANVALVVPFDSVVYERTSPRKAITVVAPSQVVVDLMTSPGRGPNEAEALLEWMGEHEDAWRT